MIEGHGKISVPRFFGLYSRTDTDNIPNNHLTDTLNVIPSGDDIKTREGTEVVYTKGDILRIYPYRKYGEATRFLILVSGGNIYDSNDLNTAILSIASMTDFSAVTLYNRVYLTPHNRITGLAGEKVYVYDGTGTFRAAAGSAPTGFTLGVADSLNSGWVEAGTRVYAVCYQTASGFITAPGPTIFTTLNSSGYKKVNFSNVPVGPSGTIARYLICTKVIDSYDGNQNAQSYYFIPDGKINDNTTTTLEVDFFDAALVSSADYLFDQLSEIPASNGLLAYQGSLITYGENSYPYIIRCSVQGQPESFNEEIGFALVSPEDSSSIKNVVEFRNQLVICKTNKSVTTQRISGSEIAYWNFTNLDDSIGAEQFGIGLVYGNPGSFQDFFVTAHRSGLYLFNGSYSFNLSAKIDTLWRSLNQQYFDTVQVVMDTDKKRVYCAVPTGSNQYPDKLLVMDYSDGISPEQVTWWWWSFPFNPRTIALDMDSSTKQVILYLASTNVHKLTSATSDNETAINSYIETPKYTFSENNDLCTFTGLRMRIVGAGTLSMTLKGVDNVVTKALTNRTLSLLPGKSLLHPLNFVNERASILLGTNSAGSYFTLRDFKVFGVPIYSESPQ